MNTKYAITEDQTQLIALTVDPHKSHLHFGGSVDISYLNETKVLGCYLQADIIGPYTVVFAVEM